MSAERVAMWEARVETQWTYWPVLLVAVLAALVVPWFLGLLDVDLRAALWILIGTATGLALLGTRLSRAASEPAAWLRIAPHLAATLLLCGLWYWNGTFRVASLLILFALPVLAAATVSKGWLQHAVAAVAVAGVVSAGWASSPALRWYCGRFVALPAWLGDRLTNETPTIATSTAAAQQLLTLAHFGIAMLATAAVGGAIARAIERLSTELAAAALARNESETLARHLLAESGAGEALVAPLSGTIVSANAAFCALAGTAIGDGRTLQAVLAPEYPESLQQLLDADAAGGLSGVACRVANERRVFDIAVAPFDVDGERLRSVTVRETARGDLVGAGLDALGLAVLVLAPDRRVLFCSAAFAAVFPAAVAGATAADALGRFGLPTRWWDIAPLSQHVVRFASGTGRYEAVVARSEGELRGALTVIQLQLGADTDA